MASIRDRAAFGDGEVAPRVWTALQENPPLFMLIHDFTESFEPIEVVTYDNVKAILGPLGFERCGDVVFRPLDMPGGWSIKKLVERADRRSLRNDMLEPEEVARVVLSKVGLFPSLTGEIDDRPMEVKHAARWLMFPDPPLPAKTLRSHVEALGGTIGAGGMIERIEEVAA
ncbi:MAG: hypothetical protein QNJ13_17440 [Paracoccaceae bacterium]|nr:hypothetical protein [Paracoccaceae bacterium]